MDINETIHDRIGELVKEFGEGKNTVFASKLGVSEGNIRGYIKGIVPKHDILEKIVKCFDINAEWLLTGIGEMKRKEVRPFQMKPTRIVLRISYCLLFRKKIL